MSNIGEDDLNPFARPSPWPGLGAQPVRLDLKPRAAPAPPPEPEPPPHYPAEELGPGEAVARLRALVEDAVALAAGEPSAAARVTGIKDRKSVV